MENRFIGLYDLKWFLKSIDQTNPKLQSMIKYINVLLDSINTNKEYNEELIKKSTEEFLNHYQAVFNSNFLDSEAPDELKMLIGCLSISESRNLFEGKYSLGLDFKSMGIVSQTNNLKLLALFESHQKNPFAIDYVAQHYFVEYMKYSESDSTTTGSTEGQKEEAQKNLQLAYTHYLRSALQGYAPAQCALGSIFYLTPNITKRRNYILLSAKQGYAPAEYVLGKLYQSGEMEIKKNRESAFLYFKRAAEQGHIKAIYEFAHCLQEGVGAEKNSREYWNQVNTIANEYPPAKCDLARCYLNGVGVLEDVAKAFSILTEACKEDSAEAMELLASLYSYGKKNSLTGEMIVPKDDARSFELYHQAATQGRASSQSILGERYQHGRGVPKDLVQAQFWYKKCLDSDELKKHEKAYENIKQSLRECEIQLQWKVDVGSVVDFKTLDENEIETIKNINPLELIENLKSKVKSKALSSFGQDKNIIKRKDIETVIKHQFNKSALKSCFDPLLENIKMPAEHYEAILTIFSKWEIYASKKCEIAFLMHDEVFSSAIKNKIQFQKQKFHPKKIIEFLQYASTLPITDLTPDNIKSILLRYSNYEVNREGDDERRIKRKAERESAEYLSKINDMYGRIVCFPNRFNNYIKDEFKLSKKIDAVNECVESLQSLLQERNELLTKNRFKVERQEKNRQNDITHNDEKIKEVNALLETITGIVQTINDLQKTFNLSYFTDSASMKQLLTEGELQKPEKFLQDLEDLLDSCKKAAAQFTKNYDELERIKTLIEKLRKEEKKRDIKPLHVGSNSSDSDPSEEEKKSQEEIHEKREAAFNWMHRLDRSLQVTHKEPKTIECDAKYHTELQEERRKRKALALQERDARLQKKQDEAEKLGKAKEEAEKSRKEREDKEKELFFKSKEPIKDLQSSSLKQLEVLFASDIAFDIESEVKTRKEPESLSASIPSAFKFIQSSRPSKKRTLESLTDLSSTLDVYDQLAILEKTLTTIPYEDKAFTQTEATITYNALLGVCARAMECLKKLRTHGLIFPEMARQFRNVVFHSGDQSIIPIIDKDPKANQERLNQLRDMAIKLLSYLNSDQFKKMRHEHASGEGDPIDTKTQIINSIDSPLFTRIVLSNLSQEKDLKTCRDMLKLSDHEIDSYKNYRNAKNHAKDQTTAPVAHLALQPLLPLAEGFTLARISTYASYMKWHSGNERYRVIYYQFPKEKRAFYDLQIEAGKRFRHGETIKC